MSAWCISVVIQHTPETEKVKRSNVGGWLEFRTAGYFASSIPFSTTRSLSHKIEPVSARRI